MRIMIFALLVAALLAAGCTSVPTGEDGLAVVRGLTTKPTGPAGGNNSATNSTTDLPFAPGAAWGASSNQSNALNAKYSPSQSNSGQGGLVTGFVQGITTAQQEKNQESLTAALSSDPVLLSIVEEIAVLNAAPLPHDEFWVTRMDTLRANYYTAMQTLSGVLKESGVTESLDLGNLTNLVVIGWANAHAGKDERPPTDMEVTHLARTLSNAISASRGETVVLGPGEMHEP